MHIHSAEPCVGGEARYELLVHHVMHPEYAAQSRVITAGLARLALPADIQRIHRVVDDPSEIDPMELWALAESEPGNSVRMKHIMPALTTLVRHCMERKHEDGVLTCGHDEHDGDKPVVHRSYEEVVDRTAWVPDGVQIGKVIGRHGLVLDRSGVGRWMDSASAPKARELRGRNPVVVAPLTPQETSQHIQGGGIRLVPVLPSTKELPLAHAALHAVSRRQILERVFVPPDSFYKRPD